MYYKHISVLFGRFLNPSFNTIFFYLKGDRFSSMSKAYNVDNSCGRDTSDVAYFVIVDKKQNEVLFLYKEILDETATPALIRRRIKLRCTL